MTRAHDKITAFAEHLSTNPADRGVLEALLQRDDPLEEIEAFAKARGFAISADELAVLAQQAVARGALSDEDLGAVSGGAQEFNLNAFDPEVFFTNIFAHMPPQKKTRY